MSNQATLAAGEHVLHHEPSQDFNVEKAKPHVVQRSLLRSVFIVITCTAAMVVNVCPLSPHSSILCHLLLHRYLIPPLSPSPSQLLEET